MLLWELEKVDSASGRCALYFVAPSRPALLRLGTPEVGGKFTLLTQPADSSVLSAPAALLPGHNAESKLRNCYICVQC